jgi:hypothetical protein
MVSLKVRSKQRLRTYLGWLVATAGLIVAACFAVNCLVDPLWYLKGNVLTGVNYPFNERLATVIRFLPRLRDYDCIILGTSRATLLPEEKIEGYRCYNLAISDGHASEYLFYAKYLRERGFAPRLMIVDVRRSEFIGPEQAVEVPDFIRDGEGPPSIFASYLSLDALDFSIRTLRGDAPHHRYYDADFHAQLEVRSKRHRYDPQGPIEPQPAPFDVHAERAAAYVELRRMFPEARAIGYIPPESAWRIAAFSETGQLDAYLAAIGQVAAAYDEFLDFSIPSALTESKEGTYDGSHYTRAVNARVLAGLMANQSDVAVDWHKEDVATITALYHRRLAEFMEMTTRAVFGQVVPEKQ